MTSSLKDFSINDVMQEVHEKTFYMTVRIEITSHSRSVRQRADDLVNLLVLGATVVVGKVDPVTSHAEHLMMMIKRQGVRTSFGRLGRVRRLPVLLADAARWSEAVRPPWTRRVNVERGRERILLLLLLLLRNNTTPAEARMTSQQSRFLQLRRVVGESEA